MDLRALNRCLQRLSDVLPFVHGQWLIEDPNTWDYRVIAYRVPTGHPQYDTAHRTGVIGQVFRTEKSIVVLDVRNHVLYDPFDEEVGWELALPTRQDDRLTAVLNLEGSGSLELQPTTWHDVAQAIEAETGWRVSQRGSNACRVLTPTRSLKPSLLLRVSPIVTRRFCLSQIVQIRRRRGNVRLPPKRSNKDCRWENVSTASADDWISWHWALGQRKRTL